jgi:hypothetical protein
MASQYINSTEESVGPTFPLENRNMNEDTTGHVFAVPTSTLDSEDRIWNFTNKEPVPVYGRRLINVEYFFIPPSK